MKSNLSPFLRGVVASMEDDQTRDAVVVAETAEEAEAAVAEANSEITEATSELEQIEDDVQKLEDAAAGVESIVLALEAAQLDGGLTPQAAVFMNIALASYAEPIGLTIDAIPSVESFGGASARLSSTVASLEASKGIWQTIKDAILKAFRAVKDFMMGLWNKLFNGAAALKQYGEKLVKAADKATVKTEEFEYGKGYMLTVNGKFDPTAAISLVDANVKAFTKASIEWQSTIEGLGAVVSDAIKGKKSDEAIAKAIEGLKPIDIPFNGDEKADASGTYVVSRDGTLPGNAVLRANLKRHEDSDSALKNAYGKLLNKLPSSITIEFKSDAEALTVMPAKKSELKEIGAGAVTLAKSVLAAKAAFEKTSKSDPVIPVDADAKARNEIVNLAREYGKSAGLVAKTGGKVNAFALKIGNAAVKYGFASIK